MSQQHICLEGEFCAELVWGRGPGVPERRKKIAQESEVGGVEGDDWGAGRKGADCEGG